MRRDTFFSVSSESDMAVCAVLGLAGDNRRCEPVDERTELDAGVGSADVGWIRVKCLARIS